VQLLRVLAVTFLFLVASLVSAQRSTGGSSTPSGSSSNAGSSSSSPSPSYSGSSSSSSSSHSSGGGGSSSSSQSSSSSSSHSSSGSSSSSSHSSPSYNSNEGRAVSRSSAEPSRSTGDRSFRDHESRRISGDPNASSGPAASRSGVPPSRTVNDRAVREARKDNSETKSDPQAKAGAKPEKRNIFLFWKHPRNQKDAKLSVKPDPARPPRRCKKGEDCGVCPPGYSGNKKSGCTAPAPVYASCEPGQLHNGVNCDGRCSAGEYWNGVTCSTRRDNCESYTSRGFLIANELRGIRARMQTACSANPSAQDCLDLKQSHEEALLRYRMLLTSAPTSCRAGLPDPLSL
jgi:hypothetical protein